MIDIDTISSKQDSKGLKVPLKYADLVEIVYGTDFSSKLIAKRDFQKDETIVKLTDLRGLKNKSYTTVQVAKDLHVDLNSEFTYTNHSCMPSVNLVVKETNKNNDESSSPNFDIIVQAAKPLKRGDEITFFYLSTEWEMDQMFTCWCGSEKCLKNIQGAKDYKKDQLKEWFINSHIWNALE